MEGLSKLSDFLKSNEEIPQIQDTFLTYRKVTLKLSGKWRYSIYIHYWKNKAKKIIKQQQKIIEK